MKKRERDERRGEEKTGIFAPSTEGCISLRL